MRIRRAALVALVVSAVCAPTALADPPVPLSGAYVGPARPGVLSQFATWRGAPATVALDYLGNDDWSDFNDPTWLLNDWQQFTGNGGRLVLSVPMLVDGGGNFAAGAAGDYDPCFKNLAQKMVAAGDGAATIRLGWEFNGTWFPWSVSPRAGNSDDATEFVADWRHIVTLMRSASGSHFKFDWTVNNGSSDINPTTAYPGDAYVDFVGVDAYDEGWANNGGPIVDPSLRWNQIAGQQYGLNYWAAFARSHGKQVSVPEWGLVTNNPNGGGDDPTYIRNMYQWFKQNQPAYETYFDARGSVMSVQTTPLAAAQYRSLWADQPSPGVSASANPAGTSGSTSTSSAGTGNGPASSSSQTTSKHPVKHKKKAPRHHKRRRRSRTGGGSAHCTAEVGS
jgi:Glycosyl hydrolase family 26